MIYYILLKGDTPADTIYDENIIGQVSFNKFTPNDGYKVLREIIIHYPKKVDGLRLIDQTGKHYSVTELLTELEKYR